MNVLDFGLPLPARAAYRQLGLHFSDTPAETLWVTMREEAASPHGFTLTLLRELLELTQTLKAGQAHWLLQGGMRPVRYAVLRSAHPEIFSLGGELARFRDCIRRRDRAGLLEYSDACLQLMREWMPGSHPGLVTIALVQGRALGGGFETALAADYLVAEAHSSFGFPEVLFGLFPCSGALPLLAKRLPLRQVERMLTSGRLYTAAELLDMGVIDAVCERGAGVETVRAHIAAHARRRAAHCLVHDALDRLQPIDFADMARTAQKWVDLALALSPQDLHVMDLLIALQRSRSGCAAMPAT